MIIKRLQKTMGNMVSLRAKIYFLHNLPFQNALRQGAALPRPRLSRY